MVDRTPIMGICLGMQLFSKFSEEGGAEGLGWIDARTVKFRGDRTSSPLKVPHVGWNTFRAVRPSPSFEGIREDQRFYFTHSYHLECADPADVLAVTGYGYEFTSAVWRDNIFGVQFHPEKSHLEGIRVLLNFVAP
jgi:glutamine amidotransferase